MVPDLSQYDRPTVDLRFPGSEIYDASYYGVDGKKANYENYSPRSVPHWSRPLAAILSEIGEAPMLDVGSAYGHLVRDINLLGVPAFGVEWSLYAWKQRLHPNIEHADARALPFEANTFGTVVSLDLLEHFTPEQTCRVMDEMIRVSKRDALMIHLIGAHNPEEDLSKHLSDPTHINHMPLAWYIDRFVERSVLPDSELTRLLNQQPTWSATDWNGRMVALRRA